MRGDCAGDSARVILRVVLFVAVLVSHGSSKADGLLCQPAEENRILPAELLVLAFYQATDLHSDIAPTPYLRAPRLSLMESGSKTLLAKSDINKTRGAPLETKANDDGTVTVLLMRDRVHGDLRRRIESWFSLQEKEPPVFLIRARLPSSDEFVRWKSLRDSPKPLTREKDQRLEVLSGKFEKIPGEAVIVTGDRELGKVSLVCEYFFDV